MIPEYEKYLPELRNSLAEIGMELVESDDYTALFARSDGWAAYFAGDRYDRSSMNFALVPPGNDGVMGYEISMLMDIWREQRGADLPMPSLTNQLAFVVSQERELLVVPQPYADAYDEKNNIIS